AGRAAERMTVLDALSQAGPQPVARYGRVDLADARAGPIDTDGVARIKLAAPDAVAEAGLTAAGLALVTAYAARVGDVGVQRPAAALASHQVARQTRSLTGDVAADAVGAEPGGALVAGLAGGADLQLAAAVHHARLAADALVARRTGRVAGAGARVARERHADARRSRLA